MIRKTVSFLVFLCAPAFAGAQSYPLLDRVGGLLEELDIQVIYDTTTICVDKNVLAGYMSYADRFIICPNNINDRGEAAEVIRHELVHVSQDCKAGIENYESKPILSRSEHRVAVSSLPASIVQHIHSYYDQMYWVFEVEAYYLQSQSDDWIYQNLIRYCKK